jgi:hypothetical protein
MQQGLIIGILEWILSNDLNALSGAQITHSESFLITESHYLPPRVIYYPWGVFNFLRLFLNTIFNNFQRKIFFFPFRQAQM